MTSAPLHAQHLTQHYGSTAALDGVSLTIAPGESVAITGPSGSGKTTLLHALAGISVPDSGQVRFHTPDGSIAVQELSAEERARLRREHFGFVFQQGLLLDELSALENAAMPLMLRGVSRAEAQRQAARWLGRLGLAGAEDRRLGQLSGGQVQRVAVARAQVGEPEVVFADEPTGALDSTTSAEVLDALLGSTAQRGAALVVVTHDPVVAERCSRAVGVRDGRIVSDSAIEQGAAR